jgi:peroxiredoxin
MAEVMTHLRIGDMAPPFALHPGDGRTIRLADILRSRAAVIVFIRGTW